MLPENPSLLLGAPAFNSDPTKSVRASLGQVSLVKAVLREANTSAQLFERLALEHWGIACALKCMGAPFRMLTNREHTSDVLVDGYAEQGIQCVACPELDIRSASFPRDIAAPAKDTLFVSDELPEESSGFMRRIAHEKIIRSPYGQGGRLLARKNVVLVCERLWRQTRIKTHANFSVTCLEPQLREFQDQKIRIGLLPDLVVEEWKGSLHVFSPEDHVDYAAGLLEDGRGSLHLISDPKWYSGYNGYAGRPLYNPKETLDRVRRVCEKLDIALHVPSALHVPYSNGFVQFKNGNVLMTSGDEEMAELVANIVGEERTFFTPIPIRDFPSWSGAALHCLVGEFGII